MWTTRNCRRFTAASLETETRYSPAICIGCDMKDVTVATLIPSTCQHELRRAAEPHHEDAHSPIHSSNKCVLKEN